jgi:hypothetical protein
MEGSEEQASTPQGKSDLGSTSLKGIIKQIFNLHNI